MGANGFNIISEILESGQMQLAIMYKTALAEEKKWSRKTVGVAAGRRPGVGAKGFNKAPGRQSLLSVS